MGSSNARIYLGTLFLAFAAVVTGVNGWNSKQEYQYNIEGRTVGDIVNLNSAATGIHYKGILKIQTVSYNTLRLKLLNFTYIKIHEVLSNGWWGHEINSEDEFADLPITKTTVVVHLNNGMVRSVEVCHKLKDWEINFINGILSHIQVDLLKTNRVHESGHNTLHGHSTEDDSVYEVVEDLVLGRCKALYEISQLPKIYAFAHPEWLPNAVACGTKKLREITKTFDYNSCEQNVEYHFGLPSSLSCDASNNKCGEIWKRIFVNRITGCGNNEDFILLNSISSSRISANLHKHDGSAAEINSYLNISFIAMKPMSHYFSKPLKPITYYSLAYRFTPKVNEDQHASNDNDNIHTDFTSSEIKSNRKFPKKLKKFHVEVPSVDINEERENRLWDLPLVGKKHPHYQPFSATYLHARDNQNIISLRQKFKQLIKEIASSLEIPESIPDKMTMEKVMSSIEICRLMTLNDLKQVSLNFVDMKAQKNMSPSSEKFYHIITPQVFKHEVFCDILVICGTNPSFTILKTWIEEKKIEYESAAMVLSKIPSHFQAPNKNMIQEFYELLRSSPVLNNNQTKISAILAFSNLLRIACINDKLKQSRYPLHVIGEHCKVEDADIYLQWFTRNLKSDPSLKSVYIVALGNIAHPGTFKVLKEVIEDESSLSYLRASAIFALRNLAFQDRKAIGYYLLSVYQNRQNPVAVRLAAVSLMMYTTSDIAQWQRIAISTWYEPSPVISAFIRSSLVTLTNLKDPIYKKMSEYAKSSVYLLKPLPLGLQYAYNVIWTTESENLQNIILEQFSWSNVVNAQNIYYRFTQRLAGVSRVVSQVEFWTTNIENFLSVLTDLLVSPDDITKSRPSLENILRPTSWIRKSLNIQPRNISNLEGVFHVNFNDVVERMFPFGSDLQQSLSAAGNNFINDAKNGKEIMFQSLEHTGFTLSTATEMGFPVSFQISVPRITLIRTKVKLNDNFSQAQLEVRLVHSSQLLGDMKLFTQWDETVYVIGAYGICFVQVPPILYKATADSLNRKLQLHVVPLQGTSNKTLLFHHSVKPFTSRQHVLDFDPVSTSNLTKIFKEKEPHQETYNFGNFIMKYMGFRFSDYMKYGVSVEGFVKTQPSIELSMAEIYFSNLPSVNIEFSTASAKIENGIMIIPAKESTGNEILKFGGIVNTRKNHQRGREEQAAINMNQTETTTMGIEQHAVVEDLDVAQGNSKNNNPWIGTQLGIMSDGYNDTVNLLDEVLSDIKSGRAYILRVNMSANSSQDSGFTIFLTYASSPTQLTRKLGLLLKAEKSPWQVGITGTLKNPKMVLLNLQDMLDKNISKSFNVDLSYSDINSDYKLAVLGEMSRTKIKTEFLRNALEMQQCLNEESKNGPRISSICRNLAQRTQFWDRCSVNISYNNQIERHETLLKNILRYAETWFTPYTSVKLDTDNITNHSNRLKIVMDIDKQSQEFTLWLRSPNTEVEFSRIPANPLLLSFSNFNPEIRNFLQSSNEVYCGLTRDGVVTFDGVEFNYILDSCWHVIAKDCSGKYRISVLARNAQNETELEINLDNYKIISLKPGPEIFINGKQIILDESEVTQVEDQSKTLLIQLSLSLDKAVKVQLPAHEFLIFYSGSTTILKTGSGLAGRLCGLCGNFDGEYVGEYLNPENIVEQSAHAFATSYRLIDLTCDSNKLAI